MNDRYMNGLPVVKPYLKESVQSWLVRYCLISGIDKQGLFRFLGSTNSACSDQYFMQATLKSIEQRLGYSCENFELNVRVSRNLCQLNVPLSLIQKKASNGSVRFRYCPKCLQDDKDPYFRIDWSFEFVRYCFDHECLLENCCPHCKGEIFLSISPFTSSEHRSPIGSLMECPRCGDLLIDQVATYILRSTSSCPLIGIERIYLQEGMATMAGLVHGYGLSADTGKKISLSTIGRMIEEGTIPNRLVLMDPEVIRNRQV